MGYFETMLTTLSLALILTAIPQTSHAQNLTDTEVEVQTVGNIFCSGTGNPEPACGGLRCPPLRYARVMVSCNDETTFEETVTDTTGAFKVVASIADGVVFNSTGCRAIVKLPVASCDVLPPTGAIVSALTSLGVADGPINGVMWLTTGVFEVVTGN